MCYKLSQNGNFHLACHVVHERCQPCSFPVNLAWACFYVDLRVFFPRFAGWMFLLKGVCFWACVLQNVILRIAFFSNFMALLLF